MSAILRSLSLRLGLAFALVGTLLLGSIGLYLYQSLQREIAWRDDQALLGRLERVQLLLQTSPDLNAPTTRPELYANMLGNTQHFLWVLDGNAKMLVSINPAGLPVPQLTATREPVFHQDPDESYRLVIQQVEVNQRSLTLIAGHLLTEQQLMLSAYRANLIAVLSVGILLAFLLGFWISQRGLRPLRLLAQQAGDIDSEHLHHRLHTASHYDELDMLVSSFNQALQRLEEGFEQLTRFSGDLAHEMRTPLNNLIGQTQQSLSLPRSTEQYEQLLESNLEEFERLSRMIDSLLFLARCVQPQQSLERRATDLHALAARLCDYFEGMAEDQQLTLSNLCDGQLLVEPEMLTRALANLIANAIRYADPGSTISIASRIEDSQTIISVHNRGSGIEDAHLPRLFDRFYRVDPSRSQPGDSGGLGLAIVEAIMRLHGGSVSVSNVDAGVRFDLCFPATANT
ncbi:MAG: heavy metal sensor histidine kinase [Pseudomonas sp.]|uniref:heavy metal sensor histidine kinase n=1 Tax=Halopseudomonas laoshanensis TaxID=2268758 RepID=UPI001B6C0DF8|nr:heavy metal sensor histidine kinase [Pseudomonas sp.]MBQ0777457.1 heavy metal sensor histidine kinase [Pseudomonas sp.]